MARRRAARGTEDVLPDRIPFYDYIFGTCRQVLGTAGYGEIRTPMFEDTGLFVRSIGEDTDIVEKELFTVARGETSVSFRPEGTASVVRAYLEHNLDKQRAFQKFFYIGPMFRYEKPQAGRQRQFYQIGIEAIGARSPLLDAEVIAVAYRCFAALGLQNFHVHLNSIGDLDDRARYREVLKAFFAPMLAERCADCQRRFERNVFRMLDCKQPQCQASNAAAPVVLDHLGERSRDHFDRALAALQALEIPHTIDHSIVRGLDYYTHTVFEVRCPDLGARDAICGGGRYDHLTADLGGPDLGATGFAIGVTPTMLALTRQGHAASQTAVGQLAVFVAPVSVEQRTAALVLAERLRGAGVQADTDFEDKSLKAMFKAADKRGARLLLVLGESEIAAGEVVVKDMASGDETRLASDDGLAAALAQRLEA